MSYRSGCIVSVSDAHDRPCLSHSLHRLRQIKADRIDLVHKAAYSLWDDIYTPHSDKLLKILGTSHPDLPVFIVESEYGPLFSSPASFALPSDPEAAKKEPSWDVNRLRTSLVAISALRAQGGVGPQVTSHVWGLLKAKDSIQPNDASKQGLEWLTTEEGALWVVRTVDGVSRVFSCIVVSRRTVGLTHSQHTLCYCDCASNKTDLRGRRRDRRVRGPGQGEQALIQLGRISVAHHIAINGSIYSTKTWAGRTTTL